MKVTLSSYAAELIGTFFFLLSILVSGANPLIVGGTLALVIYLINGVSGADVNPAISFMAYLEGVLRPSEMVGYIVAQLIGAVAALYAYRAAR